jgi:hypothetical protein
MSFATSINTVLQGNTALNTAVSSRIYSNNLPDNLGVNLASIVFTYKKETGIHTLQDKNVLEDFALYVVIFSDDTVEIETIAALVRAFLDTYSDANLRDITFEGDSAGLDQDKERYFKVLEYKVIYQS